MEASPIPNITNSQYKLASDILAQARRDLRRFNGATGSVERELYLNAYDWVLSDGRAWPFSFCNVCEMLSLRPETVRREVSPDLSLGALNYWNRWFGRLLRQFHLFPRETAANGRGRATKRPSLAHSLS